jgi:hypothetical protein
VIRFPGVRLSEPTAPSTGGGGGAPTVTSVLPSTGVINSIVNITITGTNLGGSSPQLNVSPPDGITVSNRTTVNSTTWTATLTIAAGAATTARTLTITTTAGSAVGGFTVAQPGITPNFTPNPNLALAPNEVKSLGPAGSGGYRPATSHLLRLRLRRHHERHADVRRRALVNECGLRVCVSVLDGCGVRAAVPAWD